jgi:hypothetical protein
MSRKRVRSICRSRETDAMRTSNDRSWEHRKRLQDLVERMELEYDKALLALHPLGISVSAALYNQMLAAKITIQSVYLLHWSWVVWIGGIFATLASFRTSVRANQLALDQHDLGQQLDENCEAKWYDLLTTFCNIASGLLFVAGVCLAALFFST